MGILMNRRRMILNMPHSQKYKGLFITFNTDTSKILKECKVSFLPVQDGSGDASPSNIRTLKGWTGVRLAQRNENLLPRICPSNLMKGQMNNGRIASASNARVFSTVVPKNTDLFVQKEANDRGSGILAFCDTYDIAIGTECTTTVPFTNYTTGKINSETYGFLLVRTNNLENNNNWWTTRELMITRETTRVEYIAPTGDDFTVDWTQLGDIYGGNVDLITGKLIEEWKYCKIKDLSWIYDSTDNCFKATSSYNIKNNIGEYGNVAICEVYKSSSIIENNAITVYGNSDIYIQDTNYNDVTAFITDMGENIIAYPIETPIEHQLTLQTINTLVGVNNFYSDTNADLEIKF